MGGKLKASDYPPDWKEIGRRIKVERAQGRCEWMYLAGGGECGDTRVTGKVISPNYREPTRYFCRKHAHNMRQMGFYVSKPT